jgi:2-succinyl-5-enolpyruvyl-6-hydroxy-3-cyclohexene-1-carboxylate synthase
VNICVDEPLVDGPLPDLVLAPPSVRPTSPSADATPVTAFLATARRPLAVLGPLDAADREGVARFLVRWGAPVYAEPASGLREHAALAGVRLTSGEGALRGAGFDSVLRLGGVPTLRLWRDLESTLRDVPVCSVARTPFPGLTHGTLVHGAPTDVLGTVTIAPEALDGKWRDALLARDRRRRAALDALWAAEPTAEPVLVRTLSALVPANALVYLGNSLPIREWDLSALRDPAGWDVAVSRGANGIDGQLSTFFGLCGPGREHWALVGDLTTLYDLAAPWVLPQLASGPVRVVVINNGGGQIFARLSPHTELRNQHTLGFANWARMWGLAHERWEGVPKRPRLAERCVIELVPDPAATARWWQALDRLDREP